jgi:hypothetical protein
MVIGLRIRWRISGRVGMWAVFLDWIARWIESIMEVTMEDEQPWRPFDPPSE